MKLNVFARGEMAATGGIFIGNLSEDSELRWLHDPGGKFHAQHLEARLALAIGAVLQAERAELLVRDFATKKLLRALFEKRDLRFNGFAAMPFFYLSCGSDCHFSWPPNLFL